MRVATIEYSAISCIQVQQYAHKGYYVWIINSTKPSTDKLNGVKN